MKTQNGRKLDAAIRNFHGALLLISIALAHWESPLWLLLTAFVGLNFGQNAFTGFCPAETIFRKLGVGRSAEE